MYYKCLYVVDRGCISLSNRPLRIAALLMHGKYKNRCRLSLLPREVAVKREYCDWISIVSLSSSGRCITKNSYASHNVKLRNGKMLLTQNCKLHTVPFWICNRCPLPGLGENSWECILVKTLTLIPRELHTIIMRVFHWRLQRCYSQSSFSDNDVGKMGEEAIGGLVTRFIMLLHLCIPSGRTPLPVVHLNSYPSSWLLRLTTLQSECQTQ